MKKSFFLPGLALLLGVVGFFLRLWELSTAFEPNGLPIPGAPATIALICLSVAVLVVLGLLSFRLCRGKAALTCAQAFTCPLASYITLNVICAALLLGAGAIAVMNYVAQADQQPSHLLVGGLAAASGVCILLSGKKNYRKEGDFRFNGLLLVPPFFACLWLVVVYQFRAGDPIILDYVYQILAIISILLALYFMAGFSFEKGRPILTLWACGLGIYFSFVTLADGHGWMDLCLHTFALCYSFQSAAVLLGNLTVEREEPSDEPE